MKSPARDIWNWILNDEEDIIDGKIACIRCYTVQDYKSTVGTTNLMKHKDDCLNSETGKSLSLHSNNEIQTLKSSVNEKVVQFVAQDIHSFRTPSCPGFLALANKLISVGHRYGPVKAEDIVPHRTTVFKLVSKDAESKRVQLKSMIVKLQSQGLSVTLDLDRRCNQVSLHRHECSLHKARCFE